MLRFVIGGRRRDSLARRSPRWKPGAALDTDQLALSLGHDGHEESRPRAARRSRVLPRTDAEPWAAHAEPRGSVVFAVSAADRSASCNPRGQEEAPPMKHYDKDQIDQLNSFLRGERSAVETYRLALRSMGSEDSGRGARRGLRPRSERLPPRSSQPRSDRSSVRGAERRARASRARASREPPHAQRAEASDRLIRRFFSSAASAIGPRWRVGASHALVIVRPTPRGG